jgi:hypothetical protein
MHASQRHPCGVLQSCRRWSVWIVMMTAAICEMWSAPRAKAAEPADPLLKAQLEAGEFAPALARASQSADRDVWLESIAAAQAQSGDRSASFSTVSNIVDDRIRSRSLKELANQPVRGARGGGIQPDFNSLIDLIQNTVKPDSWTATGGPGALEKFPGGVFVDAQGVMRRLVKDETSNRLADLKATAGQNNGNHQARSKSPLRKVSLPRLEKEVQLRLAAGRPLDEEMRVMAGLQRIEYVMVYPESGDLVIAGPAEDWTVDFEGRVVGHENGHPTLRLEDLVVVMRHMMSSPDARFGCSITPTQDALSKAQEFIQQSSQKPLKPGQRTQWLEQLRSQVGLQTVEVFGGIDPQSRVAHVLLEADYRMKLVGIGLEEGTLGVPSYLSSIELAKGQAAPPMDVLRWWFTLNYDAILASPTHDIFEVRGQGVKVLSENELLTALGKRVHTGQSDDLNQQFAQNFTKHFAALSKKYPVYADLQNIFDLALVSALMKSENLAEQTNWHLTCFADPVQFNTAEGNLPKGVATVINHRVINKVNIVAAVSGGVSVEPRSRVQPSALQVDRKGELQSERSRSAPAKSIARNAWWWD